MQVDAHDSASILVSIKDLINVAFGNDNENVVDLKKVRTIISILATHLRILGHQVAIRNSELTDLVDTNTVPPNELDSQVTERTRERGSQDPIPSTEIELQDNDTKVDSATRGVETSGKYYYSTDDDEFIPNFEAIDEDGVSLMTHYQFKILEDAVHKLEALLCPVATPVMPDNKQLWKTISSGESSLPDMMQALQMTSRLQALEIGVDRVRDICELITNTPESNPREDSVTVLYKQEHLTTSSPSSCPTSKCHITGELSDKYVEQADLDKALQSLRYRLKGLTNEVLARLSHVTNLSVLRVRDAAYKLDKALTLKKRLKTIHVKVNEERDILKAYEAEIKTHLEYFTKQMNILRSYMSTAQEQLTKVNLREKTARIMKLSSDHRALAAALEDILSLNQHQSTIQRDTRTALQDLTDYIATMKTEKANRDEVDYEIQKKAFMSQLEGMVPQADLEEQMRHNRQDLDTCFSKFRSLDMKYMTKVRDLSGELHQKATEYKAWTFRDHVTGRLTYLQTRVRHLQHVLGDPKMLCLAREVSKDGTCMPCALPATMAPHAPAPVSFPPLRTPCGNKDGSQRDKRVNKRTYKFARKRSCLRWCGGSHTLIPRGTNKLPAIDKKSILTKMYQMSERRLPCEECLHCSHVQESLEYSLDDHQSTSTPSERGSMVGYLEGISF